MGREKTDWKEAKRLYVEEGLLMREVAEALSVTLGPVNRHCTQGGWVKAKKDFERRVAKKALNVSVRKKGLSAGEELARLSKVAHRALDKAGVLIDDKDYQGRMSISELVRLLELHHKINMDLLSLQTQVDDMLATVERVLLKTIDDAEVRKIMGEILEEARR